MFLRRVASADASRAPDGASLPGLTRQSILFARRWMPGTRPGMTGGGRRNMQRLALLAAMTALIAAPAAAQQGLTKVRVAYDGFSMTSGPLIYADKQGIFKKFGLDIAPTFIDGGSMLTQAVVGGSVDIAQNGYTPALSAAVQGADMVIIGGISNKLPFQLVVKTSITSARSAQRPERRHQPLRLLDRHGRGFRAGSSQADAQRREGAAARRRRHTHGRGDERSDRRHHGAISRHRGAFAARLSRPGRCDRYCAATIRTRPM